MGVSFTAGREDPKYLGRQAVYSAEFSVRVQHSSPSELKLFFWQGVASGVNPFERRLLS